MSNYDGKIEPIPQRYLDQTDEVLSPDEEVIHDQNKKIEQLKQKVHILNEATMKLENMVGKLCEQLKEANEVIESLRTYDFTIDDENAEQYQVKWNVDAKRFYERHGVK